MWTLPWPGKILLGTVVGMPEISNTEIWEFLHAIESGGVVLTPDGDREPQEIYASNVAYSASNGWRIVVYNDANEWDYIDEIVTADGRRIKYEEIATSFPDIEAYVPSEEMSWSRYRIPGYLRFRCPACSSEITRSNTFEKHKSECGA